MSKNIWIVSDTHFGHYNIIRYSNRPFTTVNEMNDAMLTNWNETVKPDDIVWHLGDVYFKNPEIIPKLYGHKNLILGNHDSGKDQNLLNNFEKIEMGKAFKDMKLMLSHVPLHKSQLVAFPDTELLNVHGHIHEKDSPEGPYRNVSVEKTNYRPINIEELRIDKL